MSLKYIALTALFVSCLFSCQTISQNQISDNNDNDTINNIVIKNGDARFDIYLPYIRHKRVALVVNHTSVVGNTHLCDTLKSLGINIVRVFTPEHGYRGNADAGATIEGNQNIENFDVVSLYGKTKKPTPQNMSDIDVVLYDLQDVGVRFYTYISTMHYVMEACAENNVPFVVLDRPNPNGDYVAGPVLEADCKSFVGMHPIPIVYGLTAGELAYMINNEGWLNGGTHCDLKVVKVDNYSHSMRLPLDIFPSPNLKSDLAVRLYPSLCLLEGSNVSVGRGTLMPFTIIGAPDTTLGSFSFIPKSIEGAKNPMHLNKTCYGDDLRNVSDTMHFTLKYIMKYYKNMGDKFWGNTRTFDILAGTKSLRNQIQQGLTEDSIVSTWQPKLNEYFSLREKYLLYDNNKNNYQFDNIDWETELFSDAVDSIYNKMTDKERAAQLVWITLNNNSTQTEVNKVLNQISEYQVGGILILKSSPSQVAKFVRKANEKSKTPLLFATDAENGLAMKFDNTIIYPKNMSLGAITDTILIEQFGQRIARELRSCGLNVNFAPVVDVNTNSKNPIIGIRSFGERAQHVSKYAQLVIRGMQSQGVVAVAKHFPGHGDTNLDSHLDLPIINGSKERLDSVELLPFKQCINNNVIGIMSAHISVPALDSNKVTASLSKIMLKDSLRNKYKFKGLIITDAINMAGIQAVVNKENAESAAIAAGNDVAEFSTNPQKAIQCILDKLATNEIDSTEFEYSVRRVLVAKKWCKAETSQPLYCPEIITNNINSEILAQKLFQSSVTALKSINLDTIQFNQYKYFGDWTQNNQISYKSAPNDSSVCVFVDDKNIASFNLYMQNNKKHITLAYAGNPYKISKINSIDNIDNIVIVYENNAYAKRALTNFIYYGYKVNAQIPISVANFNSSDGLNIDRQMLK